VEEEKMRTKKKRRRCEAIKIKKKKENGKRKPFRKAGRESDKEQMTREKFSNGEHIETREREL
jgi:hypothetical protein